MSNYIRSVINLALILGLAACSGAATETQRTSNPSRTLDAVIAARKTLATAFPPTEIYVLPKGGDISSPPAFVADGVVGLRVTWESESELTIHAEKARIFISEPSVEVQSSDRPHPTLVKIGLNIRGSK